MYLKALEKYEVKTKSQVINETDKKNIYGIYYSSWQVMICLFQQWPSITRKSRNLIIVYFMLLDVSAGREYNTIQKKQALIPLKE